MFYFMALRTKNGYLSVLLGLITDKECAYCAVRVNSLNVFQDQPSLSKL